MKAIYFDMDGTIADFYSVPNWLDKLIAEDATPYRDAKPLIKLASLARILNRLQRNGYAIGIVSWLSKNGTQSYDEKVTNEKIKWLQKHLTSVQFDEIKIVKYGTPKQNVVDFPNGILFDDEKPNRDNWKGTAYDEHNIIETLKTLQ